MKRLIAAGVLFILVLTLCITGSIAVEKSYTEINNIIKECEESYTVKEKEETLALAEKLEKEWENRETLLSIFVNHDMIDEIGSSIATLAPYIKTDSYNSFLAQCTVARLMLLHMRQDQRINIHSVF